MNRKSIGKAVRKICIKWKKYHLVERNCFWEKIRVLELVDTTALDLWGMWQLCRTKCLLKLYIDVSKLFKIHICNFIYIPN